MSKSEIDKMSSAASDESRSGLGASFEKPLCDSDETSSDQFYYAPRHDAIHPSRPRPRTLAEKSADRETSLASAFSTDLRHSSPARDNNTSLSETTSDDVTKTSHPARRKTDLNGAPETLLASNAGARSDTNEYSNHAQNGVRHQGEAALDLDEDDEPFTNASSSPQRSSNGRIEYFLESILLRNFIQPPLLQAGQWGKSQREVAFHKQTLELFKSRLQLVTGMAMLMLLLHTLFYIYLSPRDTLAYCVIYALLVVTCLLARRVMHKMQSVEAIRRLCLFCYVLFALGAALVVGVIGRSQMFILGGHNHIMLTTLLLPFAASDCLLVGSMTIASLAVSGYFTFMPQQHQLYFSQLFTLFTTTAFAVFVTYFQNALRRRAFDSAFDAMCSMSRYQNMSLRDTLTGGHNRRHLMLTLDAEIARAVRFSRPISLILFDLDNFKAVNDTLGHAAGDEVLIETWHIATKAVRNVDTPARYGGDEFAVVLPEAAEEAAQVIAARLQSTAAAHFENCFGADSQQAKVTLSIGIVTLRPYDIISAEQLLFMADTQLYAAKKAGKNRIA